MINREMEIFNETLKITSTGSYSVDGKKQSLKLSKKQMSEAIVLTDKKVRKLVEKPQDKKLISMGGRCRFAVTNIDSFAAAMNIWNNVFFNKERSEGEKILVLNFANPIEPGGGVHRGAKAQEEDL